MSTGLMVFSGLLAAVVVWAILVYNRLVRVRNQMSNAFAQIDVQLKRRHDLVPNLVNIARGYLQHERQTLEAVTVARQRAIDARTAAVAGRGKAELLESLDRAEAGLATALGRFAMVVEAYPELKADRTIQQLTEELTSTENRIGFSRQAFNDAVNEHNDAIARFPDALVATGCGFVAAGHLRSTANAAERAPIAVELT
ncbi:MAG: LemA family protein [Lautropia sp.]